MNDYDIKNLYEEMELKIISSMKRNYQRHLKEEKKTGFKYTQWQAEKLKELKRYQKENEKIIGSYTKSLSKTISDHMQEELKQGSINAIKQYNKILKQKLKPSKIMNKSFFKINDKKVSALIKSVNNDLKTANTAILRMTNDQYRHVIYKSAFFVGNGTFTEEQASRMAVSELSELQLTKLAIDESNKDFLSRGLACIEYKDGRRVNIASYSQMAVRTANLRAQLMGEGDFRNSIGRHLVMSTSHGGACPICKKWEKHIFIDDVYSGGSKKDGNYTLLSTAMKQGFLHPSCRHGLTTYYPELEGIEDETEEEYQTDMEYINQRINYIERNVKRYDRLAKGSIAPFNIQTFALKRNNWLREKQLLEDNMFVDITEEWLGKSDKITSIIEHEIGDFFNYKGKTYHIDGHDVVIDYKTGEEDFAKWLSNKTNKRIEMFPRFNKPDGFKSSDYKIGREYFDYKHTIGSSSQLIYHNIEKAKGQSYNFIINITNKNLSQKEIVKQVEYTFRRISWVNKIGVKSQYGFNMYMRK